jgi:surfactin synthase thioesterase subunit
VRPTVTDFGRDLSSAEINLLDGGHILLESKLDAAVALMRPFLAQHL